MRRGEGAGLPADGSPTLTGSDLDTVVSHQLNNAFSWQSPVHEVLRGYVDGHKYHSPPRALAGFHVAVVGSPSLTLTVGDVAMHSSHYGTHETVGTSARPGSGLTVPEWHGTSLRGVREDGERFFRTSRSMVTRASSSFTVVSVRLLRRSACLDRESVDSRLLKLALPLAEQRLGNLECLGDMP